MSEALFSLAGRTAVVTGGASGIGLAAARALAGAGARVVVLDRSAGSLPDGLAGSGHLAVQADVSDERSLEDAFAEASGRTSGIDILVNSAGTAIRRPAVEVSLADWEKVVAVNMTGTFLASRIAARSMIERGGGAIVNMTRALAVEWAPNGIRVNAVAPTYVRTAFIAPLLADPELMGRIEAMTPLRRIAEPEEVAAAILFLASPAAGMVTGHTLPVDGGFLAQ